MTNKYTKNKIQRQISDSEWSAELRLKPSKLRKVEFFIEGLCPTGQNAKKKSWYMSKISNKYSNKKIRFDANLDIEVNIVFHFLGKTNNDIDNMAKTVLDAFQGNLYYDDRQIKKLSLQILEDTYVEGLSVIIKTLL